ncbi:DUF192 domain-containing protein [Pseudotabrizicola sp. 4114]|uniref:DUF192 domain-containing protein n=1 Tax=Pseudotabrizicola sp. 4114 TaxID=2817731 RepID=UPI00285F9D87|nr:uncharacterized membrane protein (UPF0127 family) [Pseudorhodobacter sp. 4114]
MGSGSTRRAVIGSFAALVLTAGAALAGCRDDQVELRWPGGQARFAVEVADTDATRSRGLMFRETLPRSAGMLFVYESPRRASFWMKNTLIPLDMIFADTTGRVTKVHANAKPQDTTPIDGGAGVKLVLEINGGLAARLGIVPGAEMRHPAIANPSWSCAE